MPVSKETLQYRKENGLCSKCGNKNADGKSLCQKHLDQSSERTKRYRDNKSSSGLCPECGNVNDTGGYCCVSCRVLNKTKHHNSYIKRYATRKNNGNCPTCGTEIKDTNFVNCESCREFNNSKTKRYIKRNRENNLCVTCGKSPPVENRKRCQSCSDKRSEWYQGSETQKKDIARRNKRRDQVFNHYGAFCSCCSESEKNFLSIDHIDGNGNEHRKKINKAGSTFFKWLVDNNFPPEFQTLCMNCNFGRYRNGGICPHEHKNKNS